MTKLAAMKIEAMDTLTATSMLFENSPGGAQGFMGGMGSQEGNMLKNSTDLGVLNATTASSSTDEMMMDLFNGSDIDLLEGEYFI